MFILGYIYVFVYIKLAKKLSMESVIVYLHSVAPILLHVK